MRWLFILVLVVLVGCVLSIIWMNDPGRGLNNGSLGGAPPAGQNPLTGQPPTGDPAPSTPSPGSS